LRVVKRRRSRADDPAVRRFEASRSGRRRLALAGVLWTVVLCGAVIASPGRRPAPTASLAIESIRFERGRLPAGAETITESRADTRLGRVAADLSGVGTTVWCWSPDGWKQEQARLVARPEDRLGPWRGYTRLSPRSIHLSPEVCAQLTRLRDRRASIAADASPDALAWSVGALAHEAQHVAGIFSEIEAECYGMQSIARAARLLGRTAREARYLATLYWKHWYFWVSREYWSRECRNGGRLDLRPNTGRWP
jgi:hypothetical protein